MYSKLIEELRPYEATLIAVSKTHPISQIEKFYELGQRHFGENKVQELVEKSSQLPDDINWHLIGHLQTNKVKYISKYIHMIHSLDSLRLAQEIDKRAAQENRKIHCLIQVKIADEDSKYGISPDALVDFVDDLKDADLNHINLRGLMGMATYTEDRDQIRSEFRNLKRLFDELKTSHFSTHNDYDTLSMGMSSDYQIALEEGSNMVRVGSLLFGVRNYSK